MIVPWTTITEDKSTWPNEYFLIEKEIVNFINKDIDLYTYAECYQGLRWLDGEIKLFLTGERIEIKNILGLKWRPMPKPTKVKRKRCSGQYSGNVFYHHPDTEQLVQSDKQESPWKPFEKEKPKVGMVIVVRRLKDCVNGYCYTEPFRWGDTFWFKLIKKINNYDPWEEWMEIPK